MAAVAANAQLRQFADSPKTEAQQVFDVITGRRQDAAVGQRLDNLLRTVIDNGRLAALPEDRRAVPCAGQRTLGRVGRRGLQRLPDRRGRSWPMVVASLEKRFGRKLNASVQVEPELIGGIRVVVGDEVLDTSVKARLEQMKVALTA